jgi:hypothetical protein
VSCQNFTARLNIKVFVVCRSNEMLELPDDVWRIIISKAKMGVHNLKSRRRARYWKMLVGLSMVNKQMQRVIGSKSSEELTVRFSDLSGRCKEIIFEKVVAAIAFKGGEYKYVGQMDNCKKLVGCKIL